MKIHKNISLIGRVQSVNLRRNAKIKADSLGLLGFAKNIEDGSVHIEIEGEENVISEFIVWCNHPPFPAVVDKIIVNNSDLKGFTSFERF